MSKVQVRIARLPDDLEEVQRLCWAYRDYLLGSHPQMRELTETFYPLAEYAAMLDAFPAKYAAKGAEILLVEVDGQIVGCGMYHRLSETRAEIKRVYVSPETRGTGIGFTLSKGLVDHIRNDGYTSIVLDTNAAFTSARKLYEKIGFKARGPYSPLPEGVEQWLVFYELTL